MNNSSIHYFDYKIKHDENSVFKNILSHILIYLNSSFRPTMNKLIGVDSQSRNRITYSVPICGHLMNKYRH